MISICMLASSAAAQLLPASVQAQRMANAIEQAPNKALAEAEQKLMVYYLSDSFNLVDELLTKYPALANTTIRVESGKSIPLAYHAFQWERSAKKEINSQIASVERRHKENEKQMKERLAKEKGISGDIKDWNFDVIGTLAKDGGEELDIFSLPNKETWKDGWESTGDVAGEILSSPWFWMGGCFFVIPLAGLAAMLQTLIVAEIALADTAISTVFYTINGTRYLVVSRKASKAVKKYNETGAELERLNQVLKFSTHDMMLAILYKHGAECRQCLRESFKGDLTTSEALTLTHYLPRYGAKAEDLLKLEEWEKWLKITKEVTVTAKTLPALLAKSSGTQTLELVLDIAKPTDQAARKQLETVKHVYEQELEKQNIHRMSRFPRMVVMFLGDTYRPTTSKEANESIAFVKAIYQAKMRLFLKAGKTVPASLTNEYNAAIAKLEDARTRLLAYENDIVVSPINKIARQVVLHIRGLGEHLDLLPLFMQKFPEIRNDEEEYWKLVVNPFGVTFPVLIHQPSTTTHKIIYDARPETFGTRMSVADLRTGGPIISFRNAAPGEQVRGVISEFIGEPFTVENNLEIAWVYQKGKEPSLYIGLRNKTGGPDRCVQVQKGDQPETFAEGNLDELEVVFDKEYKRLWAK